jgi:hypothetical protein
MLFSVLYHATDPRPFIDSPCLICHRDSIIPDSSLLHFSSSATTARLAELTGARRATGLLIVLPAPSALAALPAAATAPWQALEHWLLSRELQLPVYFAHEDEQLASIIAQLGAELGTCPNSMASKINEYLQSCIFTQRTKSVCDSNISNIFEPVLDKCFE